jgi:hypothetical protein
MIHRSSTELEKEFYQFPGIVPVDIGDKVKSWLGALPDAKTIGTEIIIIGGVTLLFVTVGPEIALGKIIGVIIIGIGSTFLNPSKVDAAMSSINPEYNPNNTLVCEPKNPEQFNSDIKKLLPATNSLLFEQFNENKMVEILHNANCKNLNTDAT